MDISKCRMKIRVNLELYFIKISVWKLSIPEMQQRIEHEDFHIASSKVYMKAHRIIVGWQQLKITFASFNKTPLCHLTKHSFSLLVRGIYASCWNKIYQPEQRNTRKLLLKRMITFILKEGWNWKHTKLDAKIDLSGVQIKLKMS